MKTPKYIAMWEYSHHFRVESVDNDKQIDLFDIWFYVKYGLDRKLCSIDIDGEMLTTQTICASRILWIHFLPSRCCMVFYSKYIVGKKGF